MAACSGRPPAGTLQQALDRQLAENAEEHGIAGQAVLVLRNGRVKSYRGEDDELVPDHVFEWPEYAIVHAELYTTVDDLGAFLNAVCEGRLAKPETLLRLWKPHTRESLMDVMSRHDDAR